ESGLQAVIAAFLTLYQKCTNVLGTISSTITESFFRFQSTLKTALGISSANHWRDLSIGFLHFLGLKSKDLFD
ncbi:hypothetical protein FRC03_004870, partial [Tulasnella sp. 419]